MFQAGEEIGFFGVPDVGGDPFVVDAVGFGPIKQFQGDVMLGTIDDVVGNAGLATPFAVVAPAFGQEEFGVEHGAETRVVGAEGELDRDHAVGRLAEPAAILPLHAGGHLAGFSMAGVIDDADGLGILMIAGDDLLQDGGMQECMWLVKSPRACRRRRRVVKWERRACWLRVWVRSKMVETRCR